MTGIDDPYEEPADAELTIDTTDMTVPEAIEVVLATWWRTAGWSRN